MIVLACADRSAVPSDSAQVHAGAVTPMIAESGETYFGVYDAESRIDFLGDPLFGYFGARGWVRDSVQSDSDIARVVRRFPRGVPLDGVDSAGRPIRVVIDSVPILDLSTGTPLTL